MTDTVLLDPTAERSPARVAPRPRPRLAPGLRIGLVDISKARGDVFLAQLSRRLEILGLSIRHFRKPTYARVAPLALQQRLAAECDVALLALAD